MKKTQNPNSFTTGSAARRLSKAPSISKIDTHANQNSKKIVKSIQNNPSQSKTYNSKIWNWFQNLKKGLMKIIYNKVGDSNSTDLDHTKVSIDLKLISKESVVYGFYTISYFSFIYILCYLLSDNNDYSQFSFIDISFAFISCLIFISLLIFLFKVYILSSKI